MMKRYLIFLFLFTTAGVLLRTPLTAQVIANFSATPLSGCSPLIVQFTDLSTGSNSNNWFFGNGNSAINKSNLTEGYINAGTYIVQFIAINTVSGKTDTMRKTITVFSNPIAIFSASDSIGCAPLGVAFNNLSIPGSGKITSWLWGFGDGSPSSNSKDPNHIYTGSGIFKVTLTVTDTNGCSGSTSHTGMVHVSASTLNIGFTASPPVGCEAPATINFTNTSSSGGALTYSWNFGDTHTSTATSPPNTYSAPGTYTVTLTANSSNGCSKTAASVISVLGAANVAFSTSATSACQGTSISFADLSNPVPSSVQWFFGDGNSSVSANPSYTYAAAGTYSVKLLVLYSGLCPDSMVQTGLITIHPTPVVNFSADSVKACATPFTVHFSDNTIGASAWNWTFGDATTASTLQNPVHNYNAMPDSFNVKLVVTNSFGCTDSLTKTDYIKIIPPAAAFTSLPDSGCSPLLVNFTDHSVSKEPISTWAWNFGDTPSGAANTSALQNPTHTYSAVGTYTVNFSMINSYGCSSSTMGVVIVTSKPIIGFSVTKDSCALTPVIFTDTSKISTAWIWHFGDGQSGGGKTTTHLYDSIGTFDITLIAFNRGCSDTLVKTKLINIRAAIPRFSVAKVNCDSALTRDFANTSMGPVDSCFWDFGDPASGTRDTSSVYSPRHTYSSPGIYTVKLTFLNIASGCKKDTTLKILLIGLVPEFTLAPEPAKGCNPLTVSFKGLTTGAEGTNVNYTWLFGDGNSVTGPFDTITSHTYVNPGLFTVKVIVSDIYGCTDTLTKTDSVHVFDINPGFFIKTQSGCDSLEVVFKDTSNATPVATGWNWSFGDGKFSTFQSPPPHYYTKPGTYTVTESVTNSDGTCSVSKTNFVVFTVPTATFSSNDTLVCPGSTVVFNNTSINANQYSWNFGDGSGPSTALNPSHVYATNGNYTVVLTATDTLSGCQSILIKPNFIKLDKPAVYFDNSSIFKACPPLSVTFVDTSKSISAITGLFWNFGDGNTASLIKDSASDTYTAPGIYSVQLIVTNASGCRDSLTKHNLITVNGPSGNYVFAPQTGCAPLTVNFTLNMINTKTDTLVFGDGNFSTKDTCCITYQYTNAGTFLPVLILVDKTGCRWGVPSVKTITDATYPNANFSYAPAYPKANVAVTFTDASVIGTSWLWEFGDGQTSTNRDTTHSYTKTGNYKITEIVSNGVCIDSISKEILVIGDLVIPNVFSPNGDGVNDTFEIGQYGITQVDVHIYDRWGLEMYAKIAETVFWDGHTSAGLVCPDGTYFYTCVATNLSGVKMPFKGFVQLMR